MPRLKITPGPWHKNSNLPDNMGEMWSEHNGSTTVIKSDMNRPMKGAPLLPEVVIPNPDDVKIILAAPDMYEAFNRIFSAWGRLPGDADIPDDLYMALSDAWDLKRKMEGPNYG